MNILNFFKFGFPALFALGGTLFLVIGFRAGTSNYKIIREGIEAKGFVVDLYEKPRRVGESFHSTARAPVIQFITEDRQVITYYSTTYQTPCPYEVGNMVKIKYLPGNPQQVLLDSKDGWIFSLMFGIAGVVMSLIGYSMLISHLVSYIKGTN